MLTLATPCDGIEECLFGEDEPWLCVDKQLVVWIVLGSIGFMIGIAVGLRYRKLRKLNKNSSGNVEMSSKTKELIGTLETEDFAELSNDSYFWKKLNVMILLYKWALPNKARIKKSKKLYSLVFNKHHENEAETINILKTKLHRSAWVDILSQNP